MTSPVHWSVSKWHLPHRLPAWVPLGHGGCGRHGAGHTTGGGADATHEDTEGLCGGFSEGYVSGQQTCHLGAGGRKTWVLQAGGPPGLVSSPSSVGGHLAERHHGGGGGLPVLQVCWEEPHGGPGDPHLGGVRPDEDPAPGGLGFAVPEEQGVYRHTAHVQARRRSFRLQVHVQGMRNGVARGSQAVLGLPWQGVRPLPGTLSHL